jgi:hypothetical protein
VVVTANANSKCNRNKGKAAGAASAEGVTKLETINLLTQDELVHGCRIAHEIDNQIDAKLGEREVEFPRRSAARPLKIKKRFLMQI